MRILSSGPSSPIGPAGGALAGTYPDPSIAQDGATDGQALVWNGTAWAPATVSSGIATPSVTGQIPQASGSTWDLVVRPWSLADPPATAGANDEEFDSNTTGVSHPTGTFSYVSSPFIVAPTDVSTAGINPLAAPTSAWNLDYASRRSRLRVQAGKYASGSGNAYVVQLSKPVTVGAGPGITGACFVWCRVSTMCLGSEPAGDDGQVGLWLSDGSGPAFSGTNVFISIERSTSASNEHVINAGVNSSGSVSGQSAQPGNVAYLGLLFDGTSTWYPMVATEEGSWDCLAHAGLTQATTMLIGGFQFQNYNGLSGIGNAIADVDFFRIAAGVGASVTAAFTFSLYGSGGAPLPNQRTALSWYNYVDLSGNPITPQPTFTELGGDNTSGIYVASGTDPANTGYIDCHTTGATTPYLFLAPGDANVFPAFAATTGAPVPGLLGTTGITWSDGSPYFANGSGAVGGTSFSELGGNGATGLYLVGDLPGNAAGRVDLGSAQNPRYVDLGVDGFIPTSVAYTVQSISPTPASAAFWQPGTYYPAGTIVSDVGSNQYMASSSGTSGQVDPFQDGGSTIPDGPGTLVWQSASPGGAISSTQALRFTLRGRDAPLDGVLVILCGFQGDGGGPASFESVGFQGDSGFLFTGLWSGSSSISTGNDIAFTLIRGAPYPGNVVLLLPALDSNEVFASQILQWTVSNPVAGGPTITNPSPSPTGTPIAPSQPLQFTVGDPSDPVASDLQIVVTAQLPGGGAELVFSSLTGFTAPYAAGSSAPGTVPGTWTIARAGGWSGSPTLAVSVVDANGNRASASWMWTVLPAMAPVFSTIQSQPTNAQAQYPYGQDVSSFTKGLWGGPGMNPLGLAIPTAQQTLAEAAARRLQTDHGALMWDQTPGAQPVLIGEIPFDDPDYGFNLRQLLNASLSQQQTAAIESAIQNEVAKDERIASATAAVTLSGDPNAATLAVSLTLVPADPAVQPFLLVLTQSQFGLAINQISPVGT